jgi:hypothetical protein
VYQPPTGDLEFGDVFSADWMFDVHVRGDAVPLKTFQCRVGRDRPPVLGYQAAAAAEDRDLVLAHGKQRRAILLSDNCEIESVMVRRGRGRLTFAPLEVWPSDAAQVDRELNSSSFRRHPLPPEGDFTGGVVNLQSLFAVGQDAMAADAPDPRLIRLDADAALDLEIRWNAFATRRGPLAHRDNAWKLAVLLTADGDAEVLREMLRLDNEERPKPEGLDVAAANLLAQTLTAAWGLEGEGLTEVAEALEREDAPGASRDAILERLRELEEFAAQAQRALIATRRP